MTNLKQPMSTHHPITPTSELVQQWEAETAHTTKDEIWHVAVQAAQWGADQELEACCKWVECEIGHGREWNTKLRAARRPKPPTLWEQALLELADVYNRDMIDVSTYDIIRRALEALND
jgi:hypothetical protein